MSSTTTIVSRNAAQPVGEARPDEREQAERERRVGRHRHAPAVRRGAAGVEREVDRDRHGHAAERRPATGSDDRPPLAQLAEVELAPRLEADDEEEERHQAAVHPVAQVQRDADAAEVDRELGPPDGARRRTRRRWPRASAASTAASSTAALPVSVRRNSRSGVCMLRAHAVRSENGEVGSDARFIGESSGVIGRASSEDRSNAGHGVAPAAGDLAVAMCMMPCGVRGAGGRGLPPGGAIRRPRATLAGGESRAALVSSATGARCTGSGCRAWGAPRRGT